MSLTEIPRVAWTTVLNQFSTIHDGWLVSLDVWTPEIGTLREITDLPLLSVSADRTEADGTVTISAAVSANDHVTRTIHGATSVAIERRSDGADAALYVESAGGVKTSLRFRHPSEGMPHS